MGSAAATRLCARLQDSPEQSQGMATSHMNPVTEQPVPQMCRPAWGASTSTPASVPQGFHDSPPTPISSLEPLGQRGSRNLKRYKGSRSHQSRTVTTPVFKGVRAPTARSGLSKDYADPPTRYCFCQRVGLRGHLCKALRFSEPPGLDSLPRGHGGTFRLPLPLRKTRIWTEQDGTAVKGRAEPRGWPWGHTWSAPYA